MLSAEVQSAVQALQARALATTDVYQLDVTDRALDELIRYRVLSVLLPSRSAAPGPTPPRSSGPAVRSTTRTFSATGTSDPVSSARNG